MPRVQVKTLEDLEALVSQHRAVISPLLHRPYPAAWVINHSAGRVLQLIKAGLYRYDKEPSDGKSE